MLGITVEKGTILEWMKKEGDPVTKGEIIFIVETEKVTTEVESPASGILAKIMIPAGVEVPVLTVVAVITEPGEEMPAKYAAMTMETLLTQTGVSQHAEQVPAPPLPPQAQRASEDEIRAVLAARKLAQEKGLDLKTVKGTGPEGVILLRDVEAAVTAAVKPSSKVSTLARRLAEKDAILLEGIEGTGVRGRIMRADVEQAIEETGAPGLGKVIPMGTKRRVIARRMSESAFTAPHIYFFTDVWMEPLLEFRQNILPDFEKKFGIRPSINDFLIKAVALNILDFPLLNATVRGEEIHILPEVNIGLAVALPNGLIVPAIAHADKIGLVEIVRQRTDLVQRSQTGKLSMDEIDRGTFTISSLAPYDVTHFTAILNPPQSGILTLGKTREELTLVDGNVKVKNLATFGLSVDHRIIDGTVAADFLQNLKWKLERSAFTFLDL
jgi:pyruvate dehydrogenase E2 component (dihydrolipoamide acetyltransferase)